MTCNPFQRLTGGKTSASVVTLSLLMVGLGNAQVAPVAVPGAAVNGVSVGGGWVEATNHQVVRTASNVVYVVVSDDNPCNATGSTGPGVIRVYKGTGAQAGNANVPTAFSEVDAAHHPASAGTSSCLYSASANNLLFAPDIKLDNGGIIHVAYIDPNATNNGKVYYQTFDTKSDLWSSRVQVASGAQTNVGGGWPRGSHAVLALDAAGVPYVVYASGGTYNSIRWVAKTASGGTAWTTPATIPGTNGTNEFQPSMVTALDGTIHLAWCDNCLATHPNIKYAKFTSRAWGAVETVSSGDANVLGDGDHDQIPAIVTDSSSRPEVLYLDGTVNGPDNYVRMRYRSDTGVWTDNSPSGAAGPSNPNGTWYCHTPTNYISALNDTYVFLGHDANISPGPYQYQFGGAGNNWSAVQQLDPRNQTNVTAGAPGLDGSASVRFDPLRDNNTSIIDLIYYDENDGTAGYSRHASVYYKAIDMSSTLSNGLRVTPTNFSFSAVQGGGNPASSTVSVTNAGTGQLSFTAVSDSSWLTASPGSGTTPQDLTVATNTAGLAPGSYTGHITVASPGVQGSPASVTVNLSVTAALALSSVTLNPASVIGGNSSTGTVTLSGPAPAGGAIVSLSSNNSSAVVPGNVTVAANATSANFAVTTTAVASTTSVVISGTYNGQTRTGTLTVTPATLSSLSVNPGTVVGGNNSAGTVTLTGKAPAGGVVVILSSNNSSAQVPASVTVAANAVTSNFTVTTSTVSSGTSATLSGTYNNTTRSATLAVTASSVPVTAVLSAISLNPTSVVGGNGSSGTVTLTASAPSGGAAVSLSSSSTSAKVPASVLVAAGATTANFTVTTTAVSSTTSVTITGQYGGTKTATLNVTAASTGVLFGDQAVEQTVDSVSRGKAEAFQTTATSSGNVTSVRLYLDSASTATTVYVGLYADNGGHPGALLTQGSSSQLVKGAWNTFAVTGASIASGGKYWIAILGTRSGTPYYRDRHNGPCKSETSLQTTLGALPGNWSTGIVYADCPISAYGQ